MKEFFKYVGTNDGKYGSRLETPTTAFGPVHVTVAVLALAFHKNRFVAWHAKSILCSKVVS